jgi:adenylate cyclase class IV
MSKVEVERKYRIKRKDIDKIVRRLFDRLFTATPLLQEDRYLESAKGVTERVRREEAEGKVINLHTRKRKVHQKNSANTNIEEERQIDKRRHASLVKQRQAWSHKCPLVVRKTPRIDFRGKFAGVDVSVCIDRVKGPGGIRFGYFVELETMVDHYLEAQGAQVVLKNLKRELLGKKAKREMRGYRTMLLEELKKRAKRAKKNRKK